MTLSQFHNSNPQVVEALVGMVNSGKVPHAIMFCEDDGGGAMALANAFLEYLFCKHKDDGQACGTCPSCRKISKLIHPDVRYIFPVNSGTSLEHIDKWRSLVLGNPFFTRDDLIDTLEMEGKNPMIAVPESKALLDALSLSGLEGGYRAVVVYLPEEMNREAANRLLKIIEEPPAMTQFLFITHASERVLPTIASRCQRIRVLPASGVEAKSADVLEQEELFDGLMGAVVSRNLYASLEKADEISSLASREQMKRFCRYSCEQLRNIFLVQQGIELPGGPSESKWASRVKKTFPRNALGAFSKATTLIDRNVNVKIIFTDLVDRLYYFV